MSNRRASQPQGAFDKVQGNSSGFANPTPVLCAADQNWTEETNPAFDETT
jgi:hypothetical protein